MQTLAELLHRRRSVRHYTSQHLDPDAVAECIRLAQLAPSSSNMQLYEVFHVVDHDLKQRLAYACLSQKAATTADQFVIFVARQDLYRQRAREVLDFEVDNVARTSPADRVEPRTKARRAYYEKLMPAMYARGFGLVGLLRKTISTAVSFTRPMVTTTSEADMRTVVHKSCALAAQTFMLAMAEQDIDTCPMEGFDQRRVRRLLGLPRAAEITMVISCGKATPGRGIWGDRFRVPFDRIYRRV